MDIRSILVNVDVSPTTSTVLTCAIGLAKRFGADLIGVAADEPSLAVVGLDGGAAAAEFYATERMEIETRLSAAEVRFKGLVPAGIKSDWRAFVSSPTRSMADTGRCADLIVTGSTVSGAYDSVRKIDVGELVLSSGRSVLLVGDGVSEIKGEKIVIGWKDSREARRAVSDAMPFLVAAKEVTAITISEGDAVSERANLDDLLAWLKRHGVQASGDVITPSGSSVNTLQDAAHARRADLVVSGGYGHTRMREWLLGGVTRDLIGARNLNRFFSN